MVSDKNIVKYITQPSTNIVEMNNNIEKLGIQQFKKAASKSLFDWIFIDVKENVILQNTDQLFFFKSIAINQVEIK